MLSVLVAAAIRAIWKRCTDPKTLRIAVRVIVSFAVLTATATSLLDLPVERVVAIHAAASLLWIWSE